MQVSLPDTQKRLGDSGDTLQELVIMLGAAAVVALIVLCVNACVQAAYHKKRHLQDSRKQDEDQIARMKEHMARQSDVPTWRI